MKVHPAAELFPMMGEAEFQDLKKDIATNGQRQYATLWVDGTILDGRNRYRACQELGIECNFEQYEDDTTVDPFEFVISLNLSRRHLTTAQRSIIAAKMTTMKVGRPSNETIGQNCPIIQDAADMLHVSRRSVVTAKHVLDTGSAALIAAVEEGCIPVSLAAKVVDECPDKKEQTRLSKLTPKEIRAEITPQNDYVHEEDNEPAPKPAKSKAAPSPLLVAWEQCDDRLTMLRKMIDTLQEHEKHVLKTWANELF